MLWLLLGLLLLVCVAALGYALLTLWRRVKVLGRQVADVGETAAAVQQAVEDARVGGPLEIKPCPTCGTSVPAKALRAPAVAS